MASRKRDLFAGLKNSQLTRTERLLKKLRGKASQRLDLWFESLGMIRGYKLSYWKKKYADRPAVKAEFKENIDRVIITIKAEAQLYYFIAGLRKEFRRAVKLYEEIGATW